MRGFITCTKYQILLGWWNKGGYVIWIYNFVTYFMGITASNSHFEENRHILGFCNQLLSFHHNINPHNWYFLHGERLQQIYCI
jgi:hypothetical protein